LSQALLDGAGRITSAKFQFGDGLDYLNSCPDGAFEHLTRPQLLETCGAIVRTLKAGGRLLLRVPNGASPCYGEFFWGDLTHERPYTKPSLSKLLAPLGFEDIEAMEVAPVPHGLKSTIRAILWKLVRVLTIVRFVIETGSFEQRVLTANLFLTARKAG
jgi:hypothetical protein